MSPDEYAQATTSETLAGLGQVLVSVSSANRESLLSAASEFTRHRQGEATTMLACIEKLNHELAEHFDPKHDALEKLKLRLISSDEPISGFQSFIIVSYCWHSDEWTPIPNKICPGWDISRPMVDAIMSLRQTGEGVWIDKLCINQADSNEKKVAIGAMDILYRAARRLVILLEDVQLDKEDEDAGRSYLKVFEDMCQEVNEKRLTGQAKNEFIQGYLDIREQDMKVERQDRRLKATKFVVRMLSARWYSRAWCCHESRVTPQRPVNNPLFLCYGNDGQVISFEFRFINWLAGCLCASQGASTLVAATSVDKKGHGILVPAPKELRPLFYRLVSLTPDTDDNVSVMSHLAQILPAGCSDKGDLVSIALNTSNIPLFYKSNLKVKTVGEAIYVVSVLALAAGDVVLLSSHADGNKIHIPNSQGRTVVTWAMSPEFTLLEQIARSPTPKTITKVQPEYIELDLILFPSSPLMASQSSMEKAMEMIENQQLHDLAHDLEVKDTELVKSIYSSIKDKSHWSPSLLKLSLQIWIAISIDCGIDWIRRFPKIMRDGTEEGWALGILSYAEPCDAKIESAALTLLSHFDITRENTSNFDEDYLRSTVQFLSCIMDTRLRFLSTIPTRLPIGGKDFAITQATTNTSYIVVPVAIKHLPLWYKKAWVVEPFEGSEDLSMKFDKVIRNWRNGRVPVLASDDADMRAARNGTLGAWKLRKKQTIFGCPPWVQPMVGEGNEIKHLSRQKVYGEEGYPE